MKTTKHILLLHVLLLASLALAQQSPSPQPQTTQAKRVPCVPQPPPAPPKGIHFHIPDRLQQVINKQQAQIQRQTGMSVDLNQTIHDATAPKPCQAMPAPQPQQKPN